MSEIMWHLSFCAWLILLNVNSTSIRVVVNEDFAHFPCWVVFHCAYVPHFIYPSVEGHLGWFHFLALVTCAAGDMGLQMSLCQTDFISLGSRPRSGVAGSYGSSIFSFGRISILSSKITLFYLYFKRFIYLKGRITEIRTRPPNPHTHLLCWFTPQITLPDQSCGLKTEYSAWVTGLKCLGYLPLPSQVH